MTNPAYGQMVFQIVSADGTAYRFRSSTPWSTADWQLTPQGTRYLMTGYGTDTSLMRLSNIVFLDFGAPAGTTWSNALGKFTVSSRTAVVQTSATIYTGCTTVTQTNAGGTFAMTFAPGVGMVEYAMGGQPFLLNAGVSVLPVASSTTHSTLPPVGVYPNALPGQPNLGQTVQMLAANGSRLVMGYGLWTDLEPSQGQYQLASLTQQVSQAQVAQISAAYTFGIVNMGSRNVPGSLANLSWDSPEMESRALSMVTAIAQQFGTTVKWFQFGNEVDTYFEMHPQEVYAFATLYGLVSARVHQIAPGVHVSSTFKFAALPQLNGYLGPLYRQSELLALTYGPYKPDFSVEPPSLVASDFLAMQQAAGPRQIFLQELAYPSAVTNGSSQDIQAAFVQNAFTAIRAAGNQIAAASFYPFGDYSQAQSAAFASSTGLSGYPNFATLVETLGLFDVFGTPKKSWQVFVSEANQP